MKRAARTVILECHPRSLLNSKPPTLLPAPQRPSASSNTKTGQFRLQATSVQPEALGPPHQAAVRDTGHRQTMYHH